MSKKKDKPEPRQRLSPTATVSSLSDEFVEELNIPKLPDNIPERLADAIRKRVSSFLHCLKRAQQKRYVAALEIRLVRDAHRAVLTAYELGLPDSEVHYATFRQLVKKLGYERTEVGFRKVRDSG